MPLTEVARDLLNCCCINLRVAARAMTRRYDEALAPSGIRITQLATLSAVAFYGPFTVKELAKALVMDRTTLTADLKPLEAQGLVQITAGTDRRTRVVSISEAGQRALQQAIPLWQGVQGAVTAELGEARLGTLIEQLREVVTLTQRE
jgi:DNA-binding MarR family transcriptional regulator